MEKKNNNNLISIISVMILPIEFIIPFLMKKLGIEEGGTSYILILTIVAFVGCFLIIFLNKDLLKRDFGKFKEKLWLNILVAIALVFLMHGILYLVRIPLKNLSGMEIEGVPNIPFYLMILSTLIPLTAPFVEELIFRHHLFYRFENKIVKFIMFFVSAALFGLIHYNNFKGDLIQLIPYVVMGMVFNLIYLFYKNIWNSITVHMIFNGVNVIMGLLGLIMMQFM